MRPIVRLLPKVRHRVFYGHPWVFGNEVESIEGSYSPGDIVEIRDRRDAFVALGYINPESAILVRVLSREDVNVDEEFIRSRHATQLGLADELHPLLAMPADVRQVLLSAHREFIEASFEQIESLGGLDVFLERTAGIRPQTRDRVARELLG